MNIKKHFSLIRDKFKVYLTAFCFAAGILIAGGESTFWPWHIPIGIVLVGASSVMANVWEDDTEQPYRDDSP